MDNERSNTSPPLNRRAFLGLATVSALTLAACGGSKSQEPPQPTSTPEGYTVNDKKKSPSLRPIPDDADMVVASPMHNQKGRFGIVPWELYAVNSSTGATTRLTNELEGHGHFAVAPGGRYIAVFRWMHGDTNNNRQLDDFDRKTLCVYDLHQQEEWTLFPDLESGWGGVAWGIDGYIYCSQSDVGAGVAQTIDIHRFRPDGSDRQNLTEKFPPLIGNPAARRWVSDTGISHDAKSIAFLYLEGATSKKSRIAWMKVDGSDGHIVTDGGPLPPGMRGAWSVGDFDPEMSPDNASVCFMRVTDNGYNYSLSSSTITCAAIDGSKVWQASPPSKPTSSFYIPDWSVDDVICATEMSQTESYWGPTIFRPDGSEYRRVPKINQATHCKWVRR